MKDKNNIKKFFSGPVKGLCVVLVLAMVMLMGSSYAFYKMTVETDKRITLTSGSLEVSLDDEESVEISLDNAEPVTDQEGLSYEPYTFTLTNNGKIDGDYALYLDDVEIDGVRMADKYVKYNLVKDDSSDNIKILSSNTSFRTEEGKISRMLGKGSIEAGDVYHYKLYLWVSDSADNGVMGTTFKVRLRIGAAQKTPKLCNVTDGDGENIGDEITCGKEVFYVVASDESSVTMFSKYNIDLEKIVQKQDAEGTFFSSTAYWNDFTSEYPTYVYNASSNIYTYLSAYNKYLVDLGMTTASVSLMSYEQAIELGCDNEVLSCQKAPTFVYNTTYWLGSAGDSDSNVYYVSNAGNLSLGLMSTSIGVRPLVTMSKGEL